MRKNICCGGLVIFLFLLPIAVLFLCIQHYGVNVVFWDEWAVVRLYEDLVSNGFSFAKLFAQHNEHRMFFPNIIMLLTSYFTGWDVKAEMYISACMLSITYYVCVKTAIGKKVKNFTGKDALFAALTGGCLFSACQWENLLMGFQLAWYLIVISVIFSLVFYAKYYEKGRIMDGSVSLVFATVATYSSLQGIAVWFMLAALYLFLSLSIRKWGSLKKILPFGMVGAVEIAFYFYKFTMVQQHEQYRMINIAQCLEFMMKQIGYIFNNSNERVSLLLGTMLFLAAILLMFYLIYTKKGDQYVMPVGMMMFGMGVILMISIGRSNLALTSRYTTYALMILIGWLAIIYREINDNKGKLSVNVEMRQFFAAAEGMMIALCIVESLDSLQICGLTYTSRMEAREALQNYKDVPFDSLKKVCYWQNCEEAYEDVHILEQRNWNVWNDKHLFYERADISGIEISNTPLDTYNMEAVIWDQESKVMSVGGWAVDGNSMQEYDRMLVKVNDTYYKSKDHLERKDVAKHFENEKFAYSGFTFSKSIDIMHEGVNIISFIMIAQDGKTAYASNASFIYFSQETGVYRCDEFGEAIG